MSFKLVFSSFLTGQLRSMAEGEKVAFKASMTEVRRGFLSHHQIIDDDDGMRILATVGKTTPYTIEACDCGLGGQWRIFFYRTGYEPRNALEMARQSKRNAKLDTPDGMLWCALAGKLEGFEIVLFAPSTRSMPPGGRAMEAMTGSGGDDGETTFRDGIADLTG